MYHSYTPPLPMQGACTVKVKLSDVVLEDLIGTQLLSAGGKSTGLYALRCNFHTADSQASLQHYANKSVFGHHTANRSQKSRAAGCKSNEKIWYDDVKVEMCVMPDATFCGLRVDVLWEPMGSGLQDAGMGYLHLFREDGTSILADALNAPTRVTVPVHFIDYLSSLMPWESPELKTGELSMTVTCSSNAQVSHPSSGLSSAQTVDSRQCQIRAAHDALRADAAHISTVQSKVKQSFLRMFDKGKKHAAIYDDLYRQTVPSTHLMPPCFHLQAQMRPEACRTPLCAVVKLMLIGCHQCNMPPDEFLHTCFDDPGYAANSVYKTGIMNFGNCIKYESDYDACWRNSEKFTNLWGAVATVSDLGLDNGYLCGDCEDDAYSMVKLHVGIQNCEIEKEADKYARGHPQVNMQQLQDIVDFAKAVQRVACFYTALPTTCSCHAASANGSSGSGHLCTHTTGFLFPNNVLSEKLGAWDYPRKAGSNEPPNLPVVLIEGTSLVCQDGDRCHKAMQSLDPRSTEQLHRKIQNSLDPVLAESTRFIVAESSGFYAHITQITTPVMGFYAKHNGVYGVPFATFEQPSQWQLEPMYPDGFSQAEVSAMKRMAIAQCPVYKLNAGVPTRKNTSTPQQTPRRSARAAKELTETRQTSGANMQACIRLHCDMNKSHGISGSCLDSNDLSSTWVGGILRGFSSQKSGQLSAQSPDNAPSPHVFIDTVPVCAGVNITLYGNKRM